MDLGKLDRAPASARDPGHIELRWGYAASVAAAVRECWSACHDDNPKLALGLRIAPAHLARQDWLCSGWAGDRCIGAAWGRSERLHIAVIPEYHGRWLSRRVAREFLDHHWLTHVRISTEIGTPEGVRLALALGFRQVAGRLYELRRGEDVPLA